MKNLTLHTSNVLGNSKLIASLQRQHNLQLFLAGDMIMEEYKLKTPLGIRAYSCTRDGVLPDSELIFELLTARFDRTPKNARGFLFVDFPENESQFVKLYHLHIKYSFLLYSIYIHENSNQIYERLFNSLDEEFKKSTLAKERIRKKTDRIELRNQEVLAFIKINELSLVIEDSLPNEVKQAKISAFILDSSS